MSENWYPRQLLSDLVLRARKEGRPEEWRAIETAIEMYREASRNADISQNAATIAQLAYEWAKARRARFTLAEPPIPTDETCENPVPEGPEERGGPCYYTVPVPAVREDERARMCPPCRRRAEYDSAKWRAAGKLSGLSARLERACLGPREKKGTA